MFYLWMAYLQSSHSWLDTSAPGLLPPKTRAAWLVSTPLSHWEPSLHVHGYFFLCKVYKVIYMNLCYVDWFVLSILITE